MKAQGRINGVASEPLEVRTPPDIFTDDLVKRFPELRAKKAEFAEWLRYEQNWRQTVMDQLAALEKASL